MDKESANPSDQAIAAWARLVRLSGDLIDKVEAELKAAGLPPLVWYDALLELKRARSDGLRPFELQQRMLLAQYNLSRLLDRITKAGYAERLGCDDDGRGHLLRISGAGKKLLRRMWPVYRGAIARHFANKLNAAEVEHLTAILGKLGEAR
jgi:DNA-binding MarR family transcriptional regulator